MNDSTFIVGRSIAESRSNRIVAMLTQMAMKFVGVAESGADYQAGIDYEHRFAEHEHEHEHEHEVETKETTEHVPAPERL